MGFGIPAMDAADQRLFAQVNAFNEAIADGRQARVIRAVFKSIAREASIHFKSEERFFAQIGYPLLKGHAALHRQMCAELDYVKEELGRAESRATWIACGLLVRQLFVDHTLRETAIVRGLPHADPH